MDAELLRRLARMGEPASQNGEQSGCLVQLLPSLARIRHGSGHQIPEVRRVVPMCQVGKLMDDYVLNECSFVITKRQLKRSVPSAAQLPHCRRWSRMSIRDFSPRPSSGHQRSRPAASLSAARDLYHSIKECRIASSRLASSRPCGTSTRNRQ